jgi:hypothetical protein
MVEVIASSVAMDFSDDHLRVCEGPGDRGEVAGADKDLNAAELRMDPRLIQKLAAPARSALHR